MESLIVSVSGVRGIVGESLTGPVAGNFAKAFATTLGAGATVVLGRDSRPSGPEMADAITAGLTACGVNVVNIGIATTPGTALMTNALRAEGGIVITASHNPGQYNGIKFLQPNGVALTAQMAGELKRVWESGQYAIAAPDAVGTSRDNDQTHDRHIEAVLKIIDPAAISQRRFKVVLDSINGAGYIVTPRLLEALGCEVVHINGEATGEFAHVPEPIETNLADLGKVIVEQGADVGFAQDPDLSLSGFHRSRDASIRRPYFRQQEG